jgi:hypothetical protein
LSLPRLGRHARATGFDARQMALDAKLKDLA